MHLIINRCGYSLKKDLMKADVIKMAELTTNLYDVISFDDDYGKEDKVDNE